MLRTPLVQGLFEGVQDDPKGGEAYSDSHSLSGAGAWNRQFTWSSGHGAALSLTVVRTALPRMTP